MKSKEERELKDAQGVDVHAYEKVCERVRAAATSSGVKRKKKKKKRSSSVGAGSGTAAVGGVAAGVAYVLRHRRIASLTRRRCVLFE